jgi:hypothetical protein
MTVTSGQKCVALLTKSDPLGAFSKMLLDTSLWVSTRCYLTWKPKTTPQGRLLFQLAVSMPRTEEIGSGLWLTPTSVQADEHPDKMKKRMEKYRNGTTVGSLLSQVKYAPPLWATPNTMDHLPAGISGSYKESQSGRRKRSSNLRDQVNEPRMWATPNAADAVGSTGGGQGKSLRTDVKMWPTPRASKAMNNNVTTNQRRMSKVGYEGKLEQAVSTPEAPPTGQLNPTWVEWLMGFPLGHTELKHWVTRSSRKSQKLSDE